MPVNPVGDAPEARRRTLDALFADTVTYSPIAPAMGSPRDAGMDRPALAIPVLLSPAPCAPVDRGVDRALPAPARGPRVPDAPVRVALDASRTSRVVTDGVVRVELVIDGAAAGASAGRAAAAESVPEVMDLPEAARFLRVSPGTLRGLMRGADLPCVRIGRLVRFRKQSLLTWLGCKERQAQGPAGDAEYLRAVEGGA